MRRAPSTRWRQSESPYDAGNDGLVSTDRATALVLVEFAGAPEDAADKTDAVVSAVSDVQEAHPDFYVGSFGESTKKALKKSFTDDLFTAGLYSLPITLIILLIAFGAVVAAGIPLLLGMTRRARHHGAGVDREQRRADGRQRLGARPAHRPGGRRGLLDVLSQA